MVGESGSGKTTLARALLGLQPLSAGEVRLGEQPLDRSQRGLRALRRQVQMVLQDASGSLNPRQTVYESVAEGVRLHDRGPDHRPQRGRPRLRGAVPGGPAPAGAAVPALPPRALGRPAAAGAHRRGVGAGAEDPAGRRAGVEPGRLHPRRGPRPAAAAAREPRAGRRGGDPRPGAGVEHRRPHRGDVPRAGGRDRHHRGGAAVSAPPLHPGAAVGRARDRAVWTRSCSGARSPTRPASRPGAGSTRAARPWPTAPPRPPASPTPAAPPRSPCSRRGGRTPRPATCPRGRGSGS